MPYKKFAKKVVKKVKEVTGNRYGRGAKQLLIKGVPQLTKDVLMMKKMLNAEKKRVTLSNGNYLVGQCSANAQGYMVTDITPLVAQGTTSSTRNGASIKLNSSYIKCQFFHQANTTQPIRLRMYVISVPGIPTTNIVGFVNSMFTPNPFITGGSIRDFNSQVNPDYFKQYRIVRQKTILLPPDQYSGALSIREVALPLKFKNHHIRYNEDSTTVTSGQLLLLVMADSGNISATVSTLANIPVTGASTGSVLNYNIVHYYYDN